MNAASADGFSRVLVCSDFSQGSALALERAALLPLREGARLDLVHVIPAARGATIPPSVKLAAQAALNASRGDLETRAREAGRGDVAVTASLQAGSSGPEIQASAKRLGADLVVLGRRARPRARDVLLGSSASRILRMADAPVLVVGTAPRGGYRRVAVALDLDRDAAKVAALAVRMPECGSDVPCRVRVIHAYDAPFEGFSSTHGTPEGRRRYRAGFRADARVALQEVLDRVPPRAIAWKMILKCGSPRGVILETARSERVDLLVLGSHRRGAVARLFLGNVAEDAIREATCDLLIWRPGP